MNLKNLIGGGKRNLFLSVFALFCAGTLNAQSLSLPFYEGFTNCVDADGTKDKDLTFVGGNDGVWDGSSEYKRNDSGSKQKWNNVGDGDLSKVTLDNEGWTYDASYTRGAYKCVRVSSKKNAGWIQTPALDFTGDATLKFKANAWGGVKSTSITVEIVDGGNGKLTYDGKTATSVTIELGETKTSKSDLYSEWTVGITGVTASGCKIKFSSEANNRFFLDKISVAQPNIYELATTVEVGVPYLIVSATDAKAMGDFSEYDKKTDEGYAHGYDVTLSDDNKTLTVDKVNTHKSPNEYILVATKDGNGYYIKSVANGKYINKKATDTAITLVDKKKKSDKSTLWDVAINSDNTADIKSMKNNLEKDRYLRYQATAKTNENTFEAYAKTEGISMVSLYKLKSSQSEPEVSTIDVNIKTKEGYATLFTDKAFTLANNLQAGIVTGVKNGIVEVEWAYKADDVIPASLPVLVKEVTPTGVSALTTTKTYTCNVTTGGTEPDEDNLLSGTLTDQTTEAPDEGSSDSYKFYRLSYDAEDYETATLGFFYGDEPSFTGAAFTNKAGLCYLALSETITPTANAMGFPFSGDTSSIQKVGLTSTADNATVYSIDGRKVSSNGLNNLAKGVYIVNGKKVLVR